MMAIPHSSISMAVHDPMHVLFQGIWPFVLKKTLHFFVHEKNYFTLNWFNNKVASYPFHYLLKHNLPPSIDEKSISVGAISSSASAMHTLVLILPFILHDKVPHDALWLNVIRLIEITILSISPYASGDMASQLQVLISEHHSQFHIDFPNCRLPPKFHYLSHFPQQMIDFGPLRNQWCMRWEAHYQLLKRKKLRNFKNLPLTLSSIHQKSICYHQHSPDGSLNLHYLSTLPEYKYLSEAKKHKHPGIPMQSQCVAHAKIKDHHYQPGCILVLNAPHCDPKFAVTNCIIINDDSPFFLITHLDAIYDIALGAYEIKHTNQSDLIPHESLENPWPLSTFLMGTKQFVYHMHKSFSDFFFEQL
jgi:hypothetical protein